MKTKNQEIICNCCKKVVQKEGMLPDSEFLHVEKAWGYFSAKDGEWQEFDICEACYDKWVEGFQVPIKTHELTELV